MNKSFSTINEFYKSVKSGEINESQLTIILDNDTTLFYVANDCEPEQIRVTEANGYYDIDKLYSLLFPKANVEWC